MSGTWGGFKALRGIFLLALLLNVVGSFAFTSYSIMPSAYGDSLSVIDEPWQPLFIGNNTIPVGDTMVVTCYLEGGKNYHIFLVGDYVNEINPQTDYDIFVESPTGARTTHTEATGLPEQVSNDALHQFYYAQESGTYTFRIHNDPEDTKNGMAEPAVFMIIEHKEINKRLSTWLEGRLLPNDPQNSLSTWACEFTTSASNFTVYVDTPDDIDMFEARVYPMANLGTTGYEIWGVPTPNGDLLNGIVEGIYGGFNTAIEGYRPASLTASCEHMGEKMKINVSGLGSSNSTSTSLGTSYFLVLIAEYSETRTPSLVPFYIKTSNVKPGIALNGTLGKVYAGETTDVSAKITSERILRSVWMNFTVNNVKVADVTPLAETGGLYIGHMPAFAARDVVDWSICAEDEIGNVGRLDSSFSVKTRTETSLYLSKDNIVGGDTVEVTGQTTIAGAALKLNFTSGSYKEIITVSADQFGKYRYTYLPKQAGSWSVSAKFDGDDSTYPSMSSPAPFTMTPQPTSVSCTLDSPEIKVNQELRLSGTTTPAVAGLPVEVTLASGGVVNTQTLVTSADGSFSISTPLEEGEWDVVAQVKGNWRYASSNGGILKVRVLPLTIIDKLYIAAVTMATPPYLYAGILASGIAALLIVRWRFPNVSSRLPKPLQAMFKRLGLSNKAKGASTRDRQKYRKRNGKN
jgi:hypothetical protein